MQCSLAKFPMSFCKILALECSTEYLSIALRSGVHVVSRAERAGQRHTELLLPMVAAVLAEANMSMSDLDGIAFGAGPGSFTGLRIACGVAQGLAFGADLPVIGVSTLLALAAASPASRVVVALDARMGEIYLAGYEKVNGEWKTIISPCLTQPDVVPPLPGANWYGAGSGFAAHGEALRACYGDQLIEIDSEVYPPAIHIAALAEVMFAAGQHVPAAQALPIYVRDKVALTERERGVAP